jgi:hypothetical protein
MAEASSGGAPAMGNLPTAVEGPREAPLGDVSVREAAQK